MPKIKFTSIKCSVPDEIDKDEMYLKYNGEKIWPEGTKFFRVDVDDEVDMDLTMEVPAGQVVIELWDYDYVSLNDHLGSFTFTVDDQQGKYSTSMKMNEKETHSASYLLHWEIL
ncbi:MAG: hypothetical protein GY816_13685 [Cytophagales bacterium]|nr:hypothetical protein [Cytophagales bacterium]